MFDVGMLGAISNLSPHAILNYDYGSYKGYFAENFVLQELLARENDPLYSWQESSAQVEFLMEKDGKVIPIEVKAGNTTKAKSLSAFAKKYQPPYRVIVSGKPYMISNDGQVKNFPLYLAGFLL
jgi:predicted AAA+ superfamily ATPase